MKSPEALPEALPEPLPEALPEDLSADAEKQSHMEHRIEELEFKIQRLEERYLQSLNMLTDKINQPTCPVDVWFYATASSTVVVCNDFKEQDEEYGVLEIGEKVVLNYPMIQDGLQCSHVWIQVRRLHENGKICFRWVRFLIDGVIQFQDLKL